jgi:Putative zinc-finger
VSRHVDEQTLAAFREGLLPARKAARITAHLATCPRCAEVDAQLAAVTTILARTPAPPMPASLAARLDAALAAEIARSADASPSMAAAPAGAAPPAGVPAPGTASSAGTAAPAGDGSRDGAGSPDGASPAGAPAPGERAGRRGKTPAGRDPAGRQAGRWRLAPRLAAAAAAVVILAGGGYAIAHVLSPGSTGTSASTSVGAAPSRTATSEPSGSGRLPAAAPAAPTAAGPSVVASGTHYRPGHLPAQVGAVLGLSPTAPGSSLRRPKAAPSASVAAFPHLTACVAHLAGGVQPRLVDIARYGTRQAAVIVVPVPGTAELRVWVVGPGCSAQGGDVITRVSMPASG